MSESLSPDLMSVLVRSHDEFLRFLESRLGSRAAAEDVLQSAYLKGMERGESIRDDESAVAWFYRVLRNAVVDHHRHRQVEVRAVQWKSREGDGTDPGDPDLERAVCQCMKGILPTLKGEYADILQKVDLDGAAVSDVAKAEQITPNNAMVRLHRARKALQGRLIQTCGTCTEHGCLDCTCKQDSP